MSEPIDIKHYLPHRKPMLMVDMILEMDHENVQTVFEIKADNIFVSNGNFIESGLIENAAQTCSAIVAKDFYVDENNKDREDVRNWLYKRFENAQNSCIAQNRKHHYHQRNPLRLSLSPRPILCVR